MNEATADLPYPMVRGSGAFLISIGIGIAAAASWPGATPMARPVLFVCAIFGVLALPIARRIAKAGRPARIHIVAMICAVILELLLFYLVFSRLPIGTPVRERWLWAFLIVGLHFIPMGLALGIRAVLLGVACTVSAAVGLLFPQVPFVYLAVLDGLMKVASGASFVLTGRPKVTIYHGVTP